MNIIVKPFGSELCYCRPDTTWERENKDFYVPDCIDEINWAPIIFVRISKAGKCIGEKFASRYYDAFNFGALMYCNQGETAFTSCVDHSSLLPAPLYNPVVMEGSDNVYEVKKNGETVFGFPRVAFARGMAPSESPLKEMVEDAVCKASRLTSLRIGDFVAVELTPVCPLASRQEGEVAFKATYCENELYDMKVIF
ncbi:MAG: hypothetical protein IJZ69_08145 [Bacteroidales bacterium]|nr:hypothetical protein [Bacteroidales bacterium]